MLSHSCATLTTVVSSGNGAPDTTTVNRMSMTHGWFAPWSTIDP